MEKILLFLMVAATLVQLFFWLAIFGRVAFFDFGFRISDFGGISGLAEIRNPKSEISIVVCARNEAENLRRNLPFLLSQKMENLEILVVDDASTDATAAVLQHFLESENGSRLRVLTLNEKKSAGKKAALTAGIAAARGSILVLTDADCRPASPFWVEKMVAPFEDEKIEIALGYAPLEPSENTFLNKWQRFETAWTALQYFGFALAGRPYMGVGRNLAYRKSTFLRVGGFEKHEKWPSGDDDLFVNEAATSSNVAVVLMPEAFCFSKGKATWRELFRQKKRHFSVGGRYRMFHRAMLGVMVMSAGWHYLLALVAALTGVSMIVVSICIVLRMTVLCAIWHLSVRRFGEKGLWMVPLFDPLLILYYAVFSGSIFFRNNKSSSWT